MLRTLALVLACVTLAAGPVAAKKRHPARGHAHAAKKAKRGKAKALARSQPAAPAVRVAAAEHRITPSTSLPEASSPSSSSPSPSSSSPSSPSWSSSSASAAAPSPSTAAVPATPPAPPVEHGPLGPQAGDDEVPGSRMKR